MALHWGFALAGLALGAAQAGLGAKQQADALKEQKKQREQQQAQFDAQQRQIKENEARQDKAEANAMNTSSDFAKLENGNNNNTSGGTLGNSTLNQGLLSGGTNPPTMNV